MLDDNDKHVLGVIKEIEKINNGNKIYEQQLKSGAITEEIYDAHKKENTKKSIDLNAEYVKAIQSRNSAIDDEIKQSQTKSVSVFIFFFSSSICCVVNGS